MKTKKPHRYFISQKIDSYLEGVYQAYRFTVRFFKEAFQPPLHIGEIINQCYEVGLKSLALISLTGFIVGIVFTKQSRPSLEDFGAASWLPSLIGIAIVKALGPLVTALICAGKVGSSIGAELGSMKVTEQIEAMEVSAINPFKYLTVTRVIATTITIPISDSLGEWHKPNIASSIGQEQLYKKYNLNVYPNPATDFAKIAYTLPTSADISIQIIGMNGQQSSLLFNGKQQAGEYQLDTKSLNLTAGTYFARIVINNEPMVKRFTIIQ